VRSGWLPGGILKGGSGRAARWSRDELEVYLAPLREPARARASVGLYRTFLTREAPAIARGTYTSTELTVPTLSIWGSESKLAAITGIPASAANHRVEVVEGAGHFVPEEAPGEVNALVRHFLAAPRAAG
jgi:pimeloyl-ACP methyl ester carboxylesterase